MGYKLLECLNLRCANAEVISTNQADLPEAAREFPTLLSVERFDRGSDGRRIHMEEFAQALNYRPSHKYGESLLSDYGHGRARDPHQERRLGFLVSAALRSVALVA